MLAVTDAQSRSQTRRSVARTTYRLQVRRPRVPELGDYRVLQRLFSSFLTGYAALASPR